jgi:hypothetical protein
MRIKIVLVKLVFHRVEGFKMEQRPVIKFCVKSKKRDIETFEMLKSAFGEEFLSRTSVIEWYKRLEEGGESDKAKIAGENNLDCIFYAKGIIHHEFCLKTDCKL